MTDTHIDLPDFLAGDVEIPNEEEARASFRVEDDATAGRFLRKLARLDAEEQRLKAQAAEEVERIKAWLEQAVGTLGSDRRFLEGALIDYHRRLRAAGKADKTYKLPAGELVARKAPDAVVIPEDEAPLIAWCIKHDRLDLLNISPAKGAIKTAVLKDGEAIPGVIAARVTSSADTDNYDVKPAVTS